MNNNDHNIQPVQESLSVRWSLAVALAVVLGGAVGVWTKHIAWQGNAFVHELSFADDVLSPETEVLFVGSSHTFQGVDPRLIAPTSANLGYGEANLSTCKLLVDRHLNELPSLKLVVVQCESWSFELDSIARQNGNYRSLLDQGVSIFDVPLPAVQKLTAIGRTATGVDYPPVTPRKLWGRRLKRSQWTGVPGFRPPAIKHTKANAKADDPKTQALVSYDEQFNALTQLIDTCKAKDIQVKLIRYPHTEAYEKKVATGSWKKSVNALIEDGVISPEDIWDFYGDKIVSLDDATDFADSNHLHPKSIPKFCKALNDLVVQALSRTD